MLLNYAHSPNSPPFPHNSFQSVSEFPSTCWFVFQQKEEYIIVGLWGRGGYGPQYQRRKVRIAPSPPPPIPPFFLCCHSVLTVENCCSCCSCCSGCSSSCCCCSSSSCDCDWSSSCASCCCRDRRVFGEVEGDVEERK